MEGATASRETVLGMQSDYYHVLAKEESVERDFIWMCSAWGGGAGSQSVRVSPWKIFYIFSFSNQLKFSHVLMPLYR